MINFSITTLQVINNKACPANFQSVQGAIDRAIAAGVILVGAAGNGSFVSCTNGQVPYIQYPAAYPGVIAVSGTDQNDRFVDTWNYGAFVDIAAPATNIWTTSFLPSQYSAYQGTSFAAPQVAALAALIVAINPIADPESMIKQTADKVDADRFPYINGWNDHLGYGRINAYKALSLANGIPNVPSGLSWYGQAGNTQQLHGAPTLSLTLTVTKSSVLTLMRVQVSG